VPSNQLYINCAEDCACTRSLR